MSAFDPAAFEAAAVTDQESSTTVTPVPEGEYNAILEDYKWRQGTSKKSQESFLALDVVYSILDDTGTLAAQIGRPPKVTQSYFCDLANGGFDFGKGKNVWLGKLREALGQNAPGQRWSFSMLKGQPLRINVVQEASKDTDDIYNRIKSVGRIA